RRLSKLALPRPEEPRAARRLEGPAPSTSAALVLRDALASRVLLRMRAGLTSEQAACARLVANSFVSQPSRPPPPSPAPRLPRRGRRAPSASSSRSTPAAPPT